MDAKSKSIGRNIQVDLGKVPLSERNIDTRGMVTVCIHLVDPSATGNTMLNTMSFKQFGTSSSGTGWFRHFSRCIFWRPDLEVSEQECIFQMDPGLRMNHASRAMMDVVGGITKNPVPFLAGNAALVEGVDSHVIQFFDDPRTDGFGAETLRQRLERLNMTPLPEPVFLHSILLLPPPSIPKEKLLHFKHTVDFSKILSHLPSDWSEVDELAEELAINRLHHYNATYIPGFMSSMDKGLLGQVFNDAICMIKAGNAPKAWAALQLMDRYDLTTHDPRLNPTMTDHMVENFSLFVQATVLAVAKARAETCRCGHRVSIDKPKRKKSAKKKNRKPQPVDNTDTGYGLSKECLMCSKRRSIMTMYPCEHTPFCKNCWTLYNNAYWGKANICILCRSSVSHALPKQKIGK